MVSPGGSRITGNEKITNKGKKEQRQMSRWQLAQTKSKERELKTLGLRVNGAP